MSSSWDSYYIVFLSAILSLAIPATLALVSYFLFSKNKRFELKATQKESKNPNRTLLGQRINVRIFLAANASLVLMTLALALIPCAITLQSSNSDGLLKGLVAIVTLVGFSILGLLYSVRKGDMGWLSSFQKQLDRERRIK